MMQRTEPIRAREKKIPARMTAKEILEKKIPARMTVKGDTGKDDTGKDDGKEDEAFTGLKEIDGIWWYLTRR